MSRTLSKVISWICSLLLTVIPLTALYYLLNLEHFAAFTQHNLRLPIQWWTVTTGQWYCLWGLTLAYLTLGLIGLYFLRRAFKNFARGEFFNPSNSQDLRRFSILLFAQALATPIHMSLMSILLSLHHPAGQKLLSISIGSHQLQAIGVALVLWVMSDLLVEAGKLQTENKQFI